MVVIRLARGGAKKRPHYSLVVADSRYARDGRHVERVGFYNPMAAEHERTKGVHLQVNLPRYEHWLAIGAKPSPTVQRLVKQKQRWLAGQSQANQAA